MTSFFAVLGILAVLCVVVAVALYPIDLPSRTERHRIEQQTHDAAWRIHEHARRAVEQMLDTAQRQRGRDQR